MAAPVTRSDQDGDGYDETASVITFIYSHMVNIVVVLRAGETSDAGIYNYQMISSYIPRSGDDGFQFERIFILHGFAPDKHRFAAGNLLLGRTGKRSGE